MQIDKHIANKLKNRTIAPSASAWERLSDKLDQQPRQKKRGWFFYIGAAASLALLISVIVSYFGKTHSEEPIQEIIVNTPIDTTSVQQNLDRTFKKQSLEEAIVKNDKLEVEDKQEDKKTTISVKKQPQKIKINKTVIAQVENNASLTKKNEAIAIKNENSIKTKILKQNPNSRIKVNSEDLLYAVTHSKEEVRAYYAKYNINRDDVLKSIQKQLKGSQLKINPSTILTEVERTIVEDDFQNNFLKNLKKRVNNIATAIASRNN